MNPLAFSGPEFLKFFVVAAVIALAATILVRVVIVRAFRDRSSEAIAARLHSTEIAFLVGGIERALATAVAGLHHRGVVAVRDDRVERAAEPEPTNAAIASEGVFRGAVVSATFSPAEEFVLSRLPASMSALSDAVARTKLEAELTEKLVAEGLLVARADRARWFVRIPALAWLALGVTKLFIGLSLERPVSNLVMILLFGGFVLWLVARVPRVTGLGERVIYELRAQSRGLEETARSAPQQLDTAETALAYAIFGAAVAAPALHAFLPVEKPVSSCGSGSSSCSSGSNCSSGSSGGSSCSSGGSSCSSGGSSCGGGGGGCGGCSS